jgi:hypothetical protein
MLKSLITIGFLFVVCAYARPQIPIDKSPHVERSPSKSENRQLIQPSKVSVQVQSAQEMQRGDTKSYPWSELIAPANIPNWALCFVGAAAGCLAYRTLRAIRKQIKLQAAGMWQWVDVETRGADVVTSLKHHAAKNPFEIRLQFEAVNDTLYLLTIQKVVTTIALWPGEWETFTAATSAPLPPKRNGKTSGHPFYVETGIATKEEFERGTLFSIDGNVTFMDCQGQTRNQPFGGLYECSPDHFEFLKPIGTVPEKQERKRKQI